MINIAILIYMVFKLDENVRLVLDAASDEAVYYQHKKITPVHVLYVLLHQPAVRYIFDMIEVHVENMKKELIQYFSKIPFNNTRIRSTFKLVYSLEYKQLIEKCFVFCVSEKRDILSIKDLLVALIQIEDNQNTTFFKNQNVSMEDILEIMKEEDFVQDLFQYDNDIAVNKKINFYANSFEEDDIDLFPSQEEESNNENREEETLKKYTIDINALANKNILEPFIGQQKCLHEVTEVLLRRKKNNVLLVGEAGVGKTALVYEFARLIQKNIIPQELHSIKLLSLNTASLVAGTRYRGDFEDRVNNLIQSFSKNKQYILLFDDMYTAMNVGSGTGNNNDFGYLIKPVLANKSIRCIGTCTYEELKFIERGKSILRHFHIVEMHEPTSKELKVILLKLKVKFEKFYNISYSHEVIDSIIELSKKYITDRFFPDKAIDVLDVVGASIKLKNHTNNKKRIDLVRKEDVESVMSKMTKCSLTSIKKNELKELLGLKTKLKKIIFGQDKAINTFVNTISRVKAGLGDDHRPLASFLLVGPTGVGKTELCKQIASELAITFHRFDMSEFQEQSAVSKFIGSPPGYIGYDKGGVLIDCIRNSPYSLLLLDEIEKAHSDIYNLLLQIMDYATITDSTGRKADFRNVLLCMTSNAGAESSIQAELGFEGDQYRGKNAILDAVSRMFSPEFRNRLDDIIIFNSLEKKNIHYIVKRELEETCLKLRKLQIVLQWDNSVIEYVANKGFSSIFGARSIKRIMKTEVHDILTSTVLQKIVNNSHISDKNTVYNITLTSINGKIHTKIQIQKKIMNKETVKL